MRRKTSPWREAELGREAELLGGNREPALQHQAGDQRHVEEDMRQHHAAEAVDVEPRQAGGLEAAAEEPGAAPDREEAEDRDDGGQEERRAEQRHHRGAAGKAPARQRAGGGHREKAAQRRGEERLHAR